MVVLFYPTAALQILVYTISAQVVRFTTLPIDFSIKLLTKWYIVTLVPRGGGGGGATKLIFEGLA